MGKWTLFSTWRENCRRVFLTCIFILVWISPTLEQELESREKIPLSEHSIPSPTQRGLKAKLHSKIYHKETTPNVIWEMERDFESQSLDHLAVQWADDQYLTTPLPRAQRVDTIRILLEKISQKMEELKIEYWIAFGTLLGEYNIYDCTITYRRKRTREGYYSLGC